MSTDLDWSPSGSMIVYTEPVSDGWLVKIINPDNRCQKEIPITFPLVLSPTWSPNEKKIAFIGSNEIVVIELDEMFGNRFSDKDFLCE